MSYSVRNNTEKVWIASLSNSVQYVGERAAFNTSFDLSGVVNNCR